MVRTSLIIGLSALLALCGCNAQDEHPQKEPAKTTSIPVTTEAIATNNVTAQKEEPKVKVKEHKSGAWTPALSEDEKETLFAIATDTLNWCVNGGKGEFSFDKYKITPKLKVPTHTFVTLKIGGNLRGCIGSLPPMSAAPLYESVYDNAVNAALKDWRFPPVGPAELPKLDVHISMLSPVTDIKSLDEFKLGEHGIIIIKGGHRAVYLP
jgi:MEMO1 family protein